ncbi:MAG: zinc ABC transporter substrate-binding protein [Pseudomonadota bacterium]
MIRALFLGFLVIGASAARADAPKVVTDIAAVQSMVARVMGDLGTPELLVSAGVSPHDYAMRPSEAAALQEADVVVWIGEALMPQLDGPIDALGTKATVLSLMDVPDMNVLDYRELSEFGDHGDEHHGHDHHDDEHAEHDDDHHGEEHAAAHDEHDHGDDHADAHDDHNHGDEHADGHDEHHGEEHADDHQGHGHDDHAAKDEHAGHDDHGHHHHGELDPHIWLDPMNAATAMKAIAELLAEKDAENATVYRENADAAVAEIAALTEDLATRLEPYAGRPFLVYHDAYQYFEARFGLTPAGSIAVGDATTPGPARLKKIREILVESGAVCVFSEPQFPEDLTKVVTEGTGIRTSIIDPHGVDLPVGAELYPMLLTKLADSVEDCLTPVS